MIISRFGGIIPRLAGHLLPREAATIAHDVKIRNGRLEPWRERLPLSRAVTGAVSVHYHGCCPYTFDACVGMAEYVADYGRLYFTGHADYPEAAAIGRNCALTYYRLGVPAPTAALSVSASEATGRDADSRSYTYTFTNLFGEEGAPAPASAAVTVADGAAVTLTGFQSPAAEYGVTTINIYRTATIYRTGEEQTQEPGTEYLLVASVPAGTARHTDSALIKSLGPAITTEDAREPPAALREITYLRGTGVLAGVTANQVHFSVPFQPSNWKAEYDMTLPYNIVHAGALGSTLFVTTDAYPYVIQGAPSCEARKCRGATEVMAPLPDIGCGHPHGAIITPFGMVYSSRDGLVLVSADARFQVITSGWLSSDDWAQARPETARLAYWRGFLICVTDEVSFMLEIDGGTYNDPKDAAMATISDRPADMVVTQSGELIMLQDDLLYQWNAGKSYREYTWRSRELQLPGQGTPLAAQVRATGITVALRDSELGHEYARFVAGDSPFRLARMGRRRSWYLEFRGKGAVERAALGMTFNVLGEQE